MERTSSSSAAAVNSDQESQNHGRKRTRTTEVSDERTSHERLQAGLNDADLHTSGGVVGLETDRVLKNPWKEIDIFTDMIAYAAKPRSEVDPKKNLPARFLRFCIPQHPGSQGRQSACGASMRCVPSRGTA